MIPVYEHADTMEGRIEHPLYLSFSERANQEAQAKACHFVDPDRPRIRKRYFLSMADLDYLRDLRDLREGPSQVSFYKATTSLPVFPLPNVETMLRFQQNPLPIASGHRFPFPYRDKNIIHYLENQRVDTISSKIFPGIDDHHLFNALRHFHWRLLKNERIETEFLRACTTDPEVNQLTSWDKKATDYHFYELFQLMKYLSSHNATHVAHQHLIEHWHVETLFAHASSKTKALAPEDIPDDVVSALILLLTPTTVGKRRGFSVENLLREYFGIDLNTRNQLDIELQKPIQPPKVIPKNLKKNQWSISFS